MQLTIYQTNNSKFEIELTDGQTILDIKKSIESTRKIPVEKQKIFVIPNNFISTFDYMITVYENNHSVLLNDLLQYRTNVNSYSKQSLSDDEPIQEYLTEKYFGL
jgi:hypothetical protein